MRETERQAKGDGTDSPAVPSVSTPNQERMDTVSIQEQTNDTAATETQQRTSYVWDEIDLDPDGDDTEHIIELMIETAVYRVAFPAWKLDALKERIFKQLERAGDGGLDFEEFYQRVIWAVIRITPVLETFLGRHADEIGRSRPGRLTEIYEEALKQLELEQDVWMPSESEVASVRDAAKVPAESVVAQLEQVVEAVSSMDPLDQMLLFTHFASPRRDKRARAVAHLIAAHLTESSKPAA